MLNVVNAASSSSRISNNVKSAICDIPPRPQDGDDVHRQHDGRPGDVARRRAVHGYTAARRSPGTRARAWTMEFTEAESNMNDLGRYPQYQDATVEEEGEF